MAFELINNLEINSTPWEIWEVAKSIALAKFRQERKHPNAEDALFTVNPYNQYSRSDPFGESIHADEEIDILDIYIIGNFSSAIGMAELFRKEGSKHTNVVVKGLVDRHEEITKLWDRVLKLLEKQGCEVIDETLYDVKEYIEGEPQILDTMAVATRTKPHYYNEDWYQGLSPEDRRRYDFLLPHKERWESSSINDRSLAEREGVTVDTIRRWRRNLRRQGAPSMDWVKRSKGGM